MPHLFSFSFYESLEFIEDPKRKERFPTFRYPILNYKIPPHQETATFAMDIRITDIELEKEYQLQISIINPNGDVISTQGGSAKQVREEGVPIPGFLVVHQPDPFPVSEGIYTVIVSIGSDGIPPVEIGKRIIGFYREVRHE